MKNAIVIFLAAFALATSAVAQSTKGNGKISGIVLDKNNQPLPLATVLLLHYSDSILIKSVICGDKGNFIFEDLSEGKYIISVSSAGYQKYFTPVLAISREVLSILLPAISLTSPVRDLQTVTVIAKKPLIEMHADKLVMNVQNSIVATGNTALEVLQKAPGVVVDQSDNISLNGKTGILIYMDGKQTYMSQSDLTNLLKNMRSDQIEKIEIISNPSAKYDAAGKAILNIITIKNKNFGTNGSISAGAGLGLGLSVPISESNGKLNNVKSGHFPRYSTSLNLNNRQGKINLFGNFNYNSFKGTGNSQGARTVSGTVYDQYVLSQNLSKNFNYKTGIDYFLNRKTTLGILVSGNKGYFENPVPSISNGYIKDTQGIVQSNPSTAANVYYSWSNVTFNGNFKHSFDSAGRELTADFDRSFYNNHGKERGLITHFYDANGQENSPPLIITNDIPNIYNITAARLDYILPLTKSKAKLEIGAKASWVTSDNDFRYFKNSAVDTGRTNHFIYKENINALYGIFNKEFNQTWSVRAGMRMEYTTTEGNSLTINQSTERKYLNLFPAVFIKQNINDQNEISYSFSRRVNRPAYNTLNPFVYFSDPYTFQIGNEKLKPAYTNSYAANYSYKHSIVTSLGYSSTKDFMAEIYKNAIDDSVVYAKIKASTTGTNIDPSKITFVTTENLASFRVLNLGVSFPVKIADWWNVTNNFTLLYVKYAGMVSNSALDYEVVPYNFYTSHSFTLPRTITMEASVNYNSKNIWGQIKTRAQYAANFGIRKLFWSKKAELRFSVNDIFATNRFYGTVNTTGVIVLSTNKSTSRSAGINFTYKFGNTNVKSARNRSTVTEDERNRIK
jgi:hypothetical protein